MPTKIRLQRFGKKRSSFYHIVIADNRAPRDGKFIEKIGTYNPNTNPASVNLEFQKALDWLQSGAQPTDTVRAILSYEGVLYKHHLDRGVLKGAFSEEDANKKYEAWKKEKLAKIQSKVDGLEKTKSEETKARLKAEEEVSKKREAAILAKHSALTEEVQKAAAEAEATEDTIEEKVEAAATETTETDVPKAENSAEEVKAEAPVEEVKAEAPVEKVSAEEAKPETATEEVKEEVVVAEAKEEPTAKAEVKTEAPAEEKKEEASEEKEDSEKSA